jgi:hypothetical protein
MNTFHFMICEHFGKLMPNMIIQGAAEKRAIVRTFFVWHRWGGGYAANCVVVSAS